MEATAKMNEICHELGVCGTEENIGPNAVGAEKAVELYKPDKPDKILITLWKDGRTTACYKKDTDVQCCYTSSKPSPELYYIYSAFFTSPEEKFGYKIRELT